MLDVSLCLIQVMNIADQRSFPLSHSFGELHTVYSLRGRLFRATDRSSKKGKSTPSRPAACGFAEPPILPSTDHEQRATYDNGTNRFLEQLGGQILCSVASEDSTRHSTLLFRGTPTQQGAKPESQWTVTASCSVTASAWEASPHTATTGTSPLTDFSSHLS